MQPIFPQETGSVASNKIGRIINHGSRVDFRDNTNMRDNQLETARVRSTERFARIASQKTKMKEYEMTEKDWKEMTAEELGKNIEKVRKENAKKLEKLEKKLEKEIEKYEKKLEKEIEKYEKKIEKLKNQVKSAIASNKKEIKKSLKKK